MSPRSPYEWGRSGGADRGPHSPFAPEKPKSRLTLLGKLVLYGGGATLVAGGIAATALWFWRPAPQLPALLPAETQALVLLRPTVRALVGLPMLRQAYPEVFNSSELLRVRGELERELGVVFERDVLPWVGSEAGLAFLGRLAGDARSDDTRAVFGMAARDHKALEACLQKIADRRGLLGDKIEARTHAGANYRVVRPASGGRTWAFGHVGAMALATSDEATFKGLAERARAKKAPSLAHDPAFRAVDHALPRDAVLTGYLAGGDAAESFARTAGPKAARELGQWLGSFRGAGFGLGLRGDGVEVAWVASVDTRKLTAEARQGLADFAAPVAAELVDDAPAGAIAALAFRFPAAARDALIAAWRDYRREVPAAVGLEKAGVDLERDLLAWLPGDMGLVVLPGAPGASLLPLDVYLASRPSQAADADAGLARIGAAIARAVPGMGLSQTDEQGLRVVREMASNRLMVAYGRQGSEIRLAIGEGAFKRLTGGGARLAESATYQGVVRHLPRPHAGLFFVDVMAARNAAQPYLANRPSPPPSIARGLDSLRALGGASSPGLSDHGLMHSSMFFHIVEPQTP